jgi:predicted nucleotidyltransferase
MTPADRPAEHLLEALQERAKELNCLYRVDEILSRAEVQEDDVYRELLQVLPPGWQYPDVCQARITMGRHVYEPAAYEQSPWTMKADIYVHGEPMGEVAVSYTEERPRVQDDTPFLKEEHRLIQAIAERIAFFVLQRRLRKDRESWEKAVRGISDNRGESWSVLLALLSRTDRGLLVRIARKMVNNLCWNDVSEADNLLQESLTFVEQGAESDDNRPIERRVLEETETWARRVFEVAAGHQSESEIISNVQTWINEENSTFLIKSLENPGTGLSELADAVLRFKNSSIEESKLSLAVRTSLRVALLRRFFVDQLDFINVAKKYVDVEDFYDLVQHLVYPARSQGKLGGKGAGLFLATQIVRKATEYADLFRNIKFPKTWYIASDGILDFIQNNTLNEIYNQKYMDIERVRQDYPHIIQVFKNSRFTNEIEKGLAAALDDLEDRPLIVRSSSILEDRMGASFSGKYKSLFLANQGSKRERLESLMDAVAEVYASVFSPDPIEYRAERGLLDFREEMGILIQEVVGTRVGNYFLPAFSGVAFSNNEFRWSPRIRRRDGLLRMVPGLGTRAVDRLSNDYPVLISPGNPELRANVSPDETIRYAPKRVDVIDMDKGLFETVEVTDLLRACGDEYPMARELVSIVDGDRLRQPLGLEPDWDNDDFVVTFEGVTTKTPFVEQMKTMLKLLREKTGTPVDLEFACDGKDVYILQCRSQSHREEHVPQAIPRDLPRDKVLFFANRYISNGRVPEISHIVYVDPEGYAQLPDLNHLTDVGRVVGKLNKLLPKRHFILIGPGRWGSRGDIKLGVNVTYSDINNTAVLMEIAWRTKDYMPDLSFGTHFFQDLVESDIRYLPLYPDEAGTVFQEAFFRHSTNLLPQLLPEYEHLADTVRVIDVVHETEGEILKILMNADLREAVGLLTKSDPNVEPTELRRSAQEIPAESHWRWRMEMARNIAKHLGPKRFGVKAIYVFGSAKNASAAPGSDLDLIVHFAGTEKQRADLQTWFEGWSLSLAESNYLRTGYRSRGLLDVHYITDEDIANQTSYAAKISAVTDAAQRLHMRGNEDERT